MPYTQASASHFIPESETHCRHVLRFLCKHLKMVIIERLQCKIAKSGKTEGPLSCKTSAAWYASRKHPLQWMQTIRLFAEAWQECIDEG